MNKDDYKYLWSKVTPDTPIFLVTDLLGIPAFEDPEEDTGFAETKVFLSQEAAEQYIEFLVELDLVRPSQLRIENIFKLKDYWSLIEEFEEIAGTKIKIDVVHLVNDDIVLHDSVYESEQLLN